MNENEGSNEMNGEDWVHCECDYGLDDGKHISTTIKNGVYHHKLDT
jgi:hypothetical protein